MQEKHGAVKSIGEKWTTLVASRMFVQKLGERPALTEMRACLITIPIIKHEHTPVLKCVELVQPV